MSCILTCIIGCLNVTSRAGLHLAFANLRTLGAQIHSLAHPNNRKIQILSSLRPGDAHRTQGGGGGGLLRGYIPVRLYRIAKVVKILVRLAGIVQ